MGLVLRVFAIALLMIANGDGWDGERGLWEDSPDLPGWYFTLLHWIVSLAALTLLWEGRVLRPIIDLGLKRQFLYLLTAIVYQPLAPFHFEYETWCLINGATVVFLVWEYIWLQERVRSLKS